VRLELTTDQKNDQAEFRAFVNEEIVPHADRYDREERVPAEVIGRMAHKGYLGALLPTEYGGRNMDAITCGLLNEEVGRGCSSLRSLLTVHGMVSLSILRWGSKQQKERWLAQLASGETIGAFALTEPQAGSDAKNISTTANRAGNDYVLQGRKKWITFGQIAGLFLVFAKCDGKSAAFLLEKNTPGLSVTPISGMLGVRASMLAELSFENCVVPKENMLGRAGFGIPYIAASALDYGRYSVAWGCVGVAQACLDACVQYTSERKQFDVYLRDHQLIQQMLTDMLTNTKAARLLCYQAGYLRETGDPRAIVDTSIAKYFASTTANKIAGDAVQIHGANGCSGDFPVQRYLRDAKIMEIIEGSTQLQQTNIAKYAFGYEEQRA
jgi:glutaryl-CoA dehydrogenase (non-decarboxylating)